MVELQTQIFNFAYQAHKEFAQNIWPKNPRAIRFQFQNQTLSPCYHNEFHIEGVTLASQLVMDAVINSHIDPLGITQSLDTWNRKYQTHFTLHDFKELLLIAFAAHDLGNLTTSNQLKVLNNTPAIEYSNKFQLEVGPSEERSASLALQLIQIFDNKKTLSSQAQELIQYLILQTVFHPLQFSSDQPFWLLMQVIDQIGNALCSKVPLHIANAGYLNELYVLSEVGERQPMSLKNFLLFQPQRLQEFFPDIHKREQFLDSLDPSKQRRIIMDYFGKLPDRPIVYETDVQMIYEGMLNKRLAA